MPQVLAFAAPCALWLFFMRDFLLGRIPVNMDTNTIYGVAKFYFNNLLNGVIPLWEPFVSLGRPFYAISICNLFNPVTQIIPLLKILGANYAQAFIIYMVVYFFIGCAGFYFLAGEVLKDRRMAYVAYVALMFSSFGASMFTQLTLLEIVVPAIWFFFFLVRFSRRQTQGNFLGLAFSSMILISSYLPFYFMAVFLCFAVLSGLLYFKETLQFCRSFCGFVAKHWRLTLFCIIGLAAAAGPLLAYKILDGSGEVVAPGRHCQYASARQCYERTMHEQGGMTLDEITRSGTLGERMDLQYLFGHLDKITYGSDSLFFLPVWIYILLVASLFLRLTRLTVLLSSLVVLIGLMALGGASGWFAFLYRHVFFFAYFRNLFFLGAFLLPLVILLALHQLQALLAVHPGNVGQRKLMIVGIVALHGVCAWFLQHFEGVPKVTYVTLGLSALLLSIYFSGLWRLSVPLWTAAFTVLLALQPAWILKCYAANAMEFAAPLPSMHVKPVFRWTRPLRAPVARGRIYQFVHYEDFWYDMSMTDAPPQTGYAQSAVRWTFDLGWRTPADVLANYAQYKIVLYDKLGTAGRPVQGPSKEIHVEHFDVNTLKLHTDFSRPKILVYNDSYTSSWKAAIDGSPVRLLRANEAFKAVEVPAGDHHIEFVYHPPGGQWVYLLASIGLFIFLLWTIFVINCPHP